jgi:hypothetical protein
LTGEEEKLQSNFDRDDRLELELLEQEDQHKNQMQLWAACSDLASEFSSLGQDKSLVQDYLATCFAYYRTDAAEF